jgi:hypothetical protein
MFLVYFGIILGYIVFKERKSLDLKKISEIMEMPPLKNLRNIQVFNKMVQFCRCFIRNFFIYHGTTFTKPTCANELKQAKVGVKTSTFVQFLLHLSMWCHFNVTWIMESCAYWIIGILKNLKWIKKYFHVKVWFEQRMFNNFIQ